MKRTKLLAGVCALAGMAAQALCAGDIRFSDESRNAGTLMKSRTQSPDPELSKNEWPPADKTDAAYYAWPFDVLFLDVNGDGHADLFMVNHAHCAWSRLWLGDGKGKFTLVDPARMLAEGKSRGSFSLVAYDFGSGSQDVLITDGDVTASQYHYTGTNGASPAASFLWTKQPLQSSIYTYLLADFNADGFVDAAVGANRGAGGQVFFGAGQPWVKDFAASAKTFVGFHSVAADMNGDGSTDIVASNFGETRAKTEFYLGLLVNDGKGGFKDMAAEAGLDAAPAGGNVAVADFNNDGLMDIYSFGYPSTKRGEGSVKFYLNKGNSKFEDVTEDSGLKGPASGWATRYVKSTAADFDNDGLVDLVNYGSTGFRLYRNLGGGKFADVTQAAGVPKDSSGEPCASAGDYDEDGRVDLALLSNGVWLGHNATETGNGWVKVHLRGAKGNPDAAGARVWVYRAGGLGKADSLLGYQESMFGTDFHVPHPLHFGLGDKTDCDVRVRFPSGQTREVKGAKAKSVIEVSE